jgi:integrase
MLWGLIDVQRNSLELVKVKGGSKRQKALVTLTKEEFQRLIKEFREPIRTMVIIAMCTGLRISEILAVRWELINFQAGTMLVERAVVNGRIGRTKTETSKDEVPLDGDLAAILLEWQLKQGQLSGLVFPSPLTGGCYHAGMLQKLYLKPADERIGIQGLGWRTFTHSYRGLLNETGANSGMQGPDASCQYFHDHEHVWAGGNKGKAGSEHQKWCRRSCPERLFALSVGFCGVEF